MGIRETLNKNPAVTTGVTLTLIVLVGVYLAWNFFGGDSGAVSGARKAYYTVDDGKTYFADDVFRVPPYDYQGQQAVRAHVYQFGDNPPFVAWMERFKADAKPKLDAVVKPGMNQPPPEFMDPSLKEVKKPGAANKWLPATFEIVSKLQMVETKDGFAREVFPPLED